MTKNISIDPVPAGQAFAGRASYRGQNIMVARVGTVDGVRSALIPNGACSVWVPLADLGAPIPLTAAQQADRDRTTALLAELSADWATRTASL
ncbi:MAG: hypothetical protein ACYCOR_10930 [Acidobacteriaceae bacterium]